MLVAHKETETGRRPITGEDLLALPVAGDPQMSPDGSQIAYTLTVVDRDANVYRSHLWLVPTRGGETASIDHGPRPGDRPALVSGRRAPRVCVRPRRGQAAVGDSRPRAARRAR